MRITIDYEKIVNSIKDFVKDQLKTAERQDEQEALSSIVQAYIYQQGVSISGKTMYDTIDVWNRIYQDSMSANLDERIEYIHLKRKA